MKAGILDLSRLSDISVHERDYERKSRQEIRSGALKAVYTDKLPVTLAAEPAPNIFLWMLLVRPSVGQVFKAAIHMYMLLIKGYQTLKIPYRFLSV